MATRTYQNSNSRVKRHARIRAKIVGTLERPRLAVFRSNAHIYAQLIDDAEGKTIAVYSDAMLKEKKGTKSERAREVGKALAQQAQEKKISNIVFDRGGFRYHGRVKALAEGAREGGLTF